jgi:hypothetical protein
MKQSSSANEGNGSNEGSSGSSGSSGAERGARQEPIAGDAWLLVVAAFLAILMKFFHETSGC